MVRILNVALDNISRFELLRKLKSGVVFTPNVDHVMKLQRDDSFHEAYSCADYIVCDSKILYYTSRLLNTPLKEKISGSDLFPAFYEYHKKNEEIKIFLLGAHEGVAREAQRRINAKVRRSIVVGAHSPSFRFENDEVECLEIIDLINQSKATVLAVGVGAPKQEKFIYRYRDMMPNVKIFLAIGATIDFEAGKVKRSPRWVSEVGLEWLYRLLVEPRRLWKRYLVEAFPFLWLILKQKFNLYVDPFRNRYAMYSKRSSCNDVVEVSGKVP